MYKSILGNANIDLDLKNADQTKAAIMKLLWI